MGEAVSVKIGVIDSGGTFQNPFFADKKILIIGDKGKIDTADNSGFEFTHGELVCAAILNENPKAEIVLVPVIRESMKCSVRDLIEAMEKLLDYGVDIINLSLGNENNLYKELKDVCEKVWAEGILIVAANANIPKRITYPADFPFVLGVDCSEERKNNTIIDYDAKKNKVIFSSNYFSIYHLGIPKMLSGNSFGCAKITGLISIHKDNFKIFLGGFIESVFNLYYPYPNLKEQKCLFLTNRIEDKLEQQFMKQVTNTVKCRNMQSFNTVGFYQWKEQFEILFIDHDSYEDALQYKNDILQFALSKNNVTVVLRYPLFSLTERLEFYERKNVVIYQFYI